MKSKPRSCEKIWIVFVLANPGNHSTSTCPPHRMLIMIALISPSIPMICVWTISFKYLSSGLWNSINSSPSSKYLVLMVWIWAVSVFLCVVFLNIFLRFRLSSLKNAQSTRSTILITRTNKIMMVRICLLPINKHRHSKYPL